MALPAPAARRPARAAVRGAAAALAAMLLALPLAACGEGGEETPVEKEAPEGMTRYKAKFANPASINCRKKDGTSYIAKRPDGGEYGVCVFDTGGQCEEWAMMLEFCPVGGVDVTAYPSGAARYCVIRGGIYTGDEAGGGQCTLFGGTVCPADAYFAGTCDER